MDRLAIAAKAHWGYAEHDLARWASELRTPPDTVVTWPTFVAESDGALAGFTQLDPTREPWELVSLWVHPRHMGRGIGRRLLRRAVAAAAASGQGRIHIDADPHAAGFYLACGARLVGSVPAAIAGAPDRVRPQLALPVSGA